MTIQSLELQWVKDAAQIPGAGLSATQNTSVSVELRRVFNLMALYYGEPWRKYHTLAHIESFRGALDQMELCPLPVKIACYFHDIIWVPGYAAAEERSADMAQKWLESVHADDAFVDEVVDLILATKHRGLCPKSMSEAYMRDADLWTLGDPSTEAFNRTQELVRLEFGGTSDPVYKAARQDVFTKMCRNAIFWSGPGKLREATAKRNLKSVGIIV